MCRSYRLAPLGLLLLRCGATQPYVSRDEASTVFTPTTALIFNRGVVAYNGEQMMGAGLDLRRAHDGRWHGLLEGREVTLSLTPSAIRGDDLNLAIRADARPVVMEGHVDGRPLRLEVASEAIRISRGGQWLTLHRESNGVYSSGSVLCQSRLEIQSPFRVQTADPKFALALLESLSMYKIRCDGIIRPISNLEGYSTFRR
jgi:hypothetical protein